MKVAAALCVLGLPGWRYLTSADRDERLLLRGMLDEAVRLTDRLQRNLAAHVVNTLGKALR